MMTDLAAVIWKEWRELVFLRGGRISLLILLGVFGVFMPLQTGRAWLLSPAISVYWIWVPLLQVTTLIADFFVGERERHTMETLLASRLSDQAILLGKVIVAVLYGWGLMVAILLLGAVSVNLVSLGKGLIFYPIVPMAVTLCFGLFGSLLVAAIGVLISMRFTTVRQAVQVMNVGMLIFIWLPALGFQALPASLKRLVLGQIFGTDPVTAVAVALFILAAVDTLLLFWAIGRFQREKLIVN